MRSVGSNGRQQLPFTMKVVVYSVSDNSCSCCVWFGLARTDSTVSYLQSVNSGIFSAILEICSSVAKVDVLHPSSQ
jgi:hypothetical protein